MGNLWPSDADIQASAEHTAQKFSELMAHTNPFAPDAAVEWLARNRPAFVRGTESFIAVDPQKAIDELEKMKTAARIVAYDLSEDVKASLYDTRSYLSDWKGPAADAFRRQIINIEVFTNRHSEFVSKCVAAMAASLAVATHARRDYQKLADETASAIDKIIADGEEASAVFLLKIGGGIAKTVIGALADPRAALSTVAQGAIDFAVETVDYSIKGVDFTDVLGSYMQAEGHLLQDCGTELDAVIHSLQLADSDLADEQFSMYSPLPSNTDVSSPDFRYEQFFTMERIPNDDFNQRVEAERKEMLPGGKRSAEISNSVIRQRLAPEGGDS